MRRLLWAALLVLGCEDSTVAAGDAGAAPDAGGHTPAWAALSGADPSIYLGAWGRGPADVWFVGGQTGPAGGRVVHFDGDALHPVPVPPGPTLWWTWGDDASVWVVGEAGRTLRRDGRGWRAVPTGLDRRAVLWGVWGSPEWGVWAVGGLVEAGGPTGVVLRWRDDAWVAVPGAPAVNLYKVWGDASGLHIVGEGGTALRWDGAALRPVDTETSALLFTVHGQPGGPVLAVGGLGQGVVQLWDGDRWRADPDAPDGLPPLNGVHVRADGTAIVSAARGRLFERGADGAWTELDVPRREAIDTLHAVLDVGDLWVVGGDFSGRDGARILTTRAPAPALPGPTPAWEGVQDLGVQDLGVQDLNVQDLGVHDLGVHDLDVQDLDAADVQIADSGQSVDAVDSMDVRDLDGQVPDGQVPDVQVPDVQVPDVQIPDAQIPDVQIPDAAWVCGDGVQTADEECDDGNRAGGDGCDLQCRLECGNGRLDPRELCDDGNRDDDDGCDASCQLECGNGVLDGAEECDDGGDRDDDGCDRDCRLECGNGQIDGDEACDDGNRDPLDGCSAACALECGNGRLEGAEECDDGNRAPDDGCDADCRIEVPPGPGERCVAPLYACAEGLSCFGLAQQRFREYCLGACGSVDDCGPEWGPDPCCTQPGPQVLATYCIPRALLPDGCD